MAHSDSIEFICAIQKNSYVCMYVCMALVRPSERYIKEKQTELESESK